MADEKFFAWLDGELTSAEAIDMEARVAADPSLQKLADGHRALAARLRGAFDPIAAEPVSLAAFAPVADTSNVASMAQARVAKRRPFLHNGWAQAASIALVFGLGLMIGTAFLAGPEGNVRSSGGELVAAASLDRALDTQLASAPTAGGGTRIGLTFRNRDGQICRSFTDQAATGLACRKGDGWQVHALFQAPEGQLDDYRMAGAPDPHLAALIEETIAGEPLDAAQEQQIQRSGWK